VLITIGLHLLPVGVQYFAGGASAEANKTLVANLPTALQYIFKDTTVAVCVISVILNLIFPLPAEERQRLQKEQDAEAAKELKQG